MVLYFSATGNSEYVASRIAEATNDDLINITKCLKDSVLEFDLYKGERIGIVVPTYCWGLPPVVMDFLKAVKFNTVGRHYTYIVATCGGSTGIVDRQAAVILKDKGMPLHASFGVRMVDNYTVAFNVKNHKKNLQVLAQAEPFIDEIIRLVTCKASGNYNKIKGFVAGAYALQTVYQKDLPRKTKRFKADNKCIGCGKCAKECPCSAIEMVDGKPVWVKEACTQCFRCIHRCPMYSISYGAGTKRNGQYINPRVK